MRYHPDPRWIATDYLNHSPQAVSPSNPYGFHGGHRRIDTAGGAGKFCDLILPVLKTNDGQGIIVWGQGGDDPRGGMYRPDFDVLPPEVEAQWTHIIAPRFDQMMKRGCTRFYLDSFGDSLEDAMLMRWLREKLGPDVRTYCEHQCDAIMPLSGGYSETTLEAERKGQPAHYRVWSGLDIGLQPNTRGHPSAVGL